MNKVIMMGRLTRDPEVSYAQGSNMAIARYSIAVDRRFKRDGEPDADFFDCTVFGKSAEFAEKYFKKGTKIVISGRLQNDNYTNKDGQKVFRTRIMVDEQEFAESKNATGYGDQGGFVPAAAPQADHSSIGEGFINVPGNLDDELPFN